MALGRGGRKNGGTETERQRQRNSHRFEAEHSATSYSLLLDWLWVSVERRPSTANGSFSDAAGETLYLGKGQLPRSQCSRVMVGSHLGPMTCLSIESWPWLQCGCDNNE